MQHHNIFPLRVVFIVGLDPVLTMGESGHSVKSTSAHPQVGCSVELSSELVINSYMKIIISLNEPDELYCQAEMCTLVGFLR